MGWTVLTESSCLPEPRESPPMSSHGNHVIHVIWAIQFQREVCRRRCGARRRPAASSYPEHHFPDPHSNYQEHQCQQEQNLAMMPHHIRRERPPSLRAWRWGQCEAGAGRTTSSLQLRHHCRCAAGQVLKAPLSCEGHRVNPWAWVASEKPPGTPAGHPRVGPPRPIGRRRPLPGQQRGRATARQRRWLGGRAGHGATRRAEPKLLL